MYLALERRELILNDVRKEGYVRTITLAKKLNVADETVRNDLKLLERKGLLNRVHGGAISVSKQEFNDSLKG